MEIVGATLVILSIIGYEFISWYEEPLPVKKETENEILVEESNKESEQSAEENNIGLVMERNEKKKEVKMPETGGGSTSFISSPEVDFNMM